MKGAIRILERNVNAANDGTAGGSESLVERGFSVKSRGKVRHHRQDALDAILRGPLGNRIGDLWQRHRDADDVGRLGRDDRCGRVHDDHRLLGFGGDRRDGQRIRREAETDKDVDVVASHQFLGQPLGDVGGRSPSILLDDLDFLSGHGVPCSSM